MNASVDGHELGRGRGEGAGGNVAGAGWRSSCCLGALAAFLQAELDQEEEVQPCECERSSPAEGTAGLRLAAWLSQGVLEAGE